MKTRLEEFLKNKGIDDVIGYLNYVMNEADRALQTYKTKFWLGVGLLALMLMILPVVMNYLDKELGMYLTYAISGTILILDGMYIYYVMDRKNQLSILLSLTSRYMRKLQMLENNPLLSENDKRRELNNNMKSYVRNLCRLFGVSRNALIRSLEQRNIRQIMLG